MHVDNNVQAIVTRYQFTRKAQEIMYYPEVFHLPHHLASGEQEKKKWSWAKYLTNVNIVY